jgi:hypothetical protein
MAIQNVCGFCGQPFPNTQERCPHCSLPSLFPNVIAAQQQDERDALDVRYGQACADLAHGGFDAIRQDFETAIRNSAEVVVSDHFNELERLASADTNVLPTYYQRVQAGIIIPKGEKWDILRGGVESAVFVGYKENIHFGALSLDGVGAKNYGECSIVLKTGMICHRASLYEDNNVVFTVYTQALAMADAVDLPKGYRAIWVDREKLCVAKLAPKFGSGTTASDFPRILLESGRTTMDDRFVEVHIWGPLTVRAIERVRVFRKANRPAKATLRDVERLLKPYNVKLEA